MKKYKAYCDFNISKFVTQNRGKIIDAFDGCLLDNYLIWGRRGVIAVYERYINPNASGYTLIFAPHSDTDAGKIEEDFYNLSHED